MEGNGNPHNEEGLPGIKIGQYRKFIEPPPRESRRSYCLGIVSFLENADHSSILKFNPNSDGDFHEFLDKKENVEKRLEHGFNLVKVDGSENAVKAFEAVGQELHQKKEELGVKILIALNKTIIREKMFKMEFTEHAASKTDVTQLAAQNNKNIQKAQGAIEQTILERADFGGATASESSVEMKPENVFSRKGKPKLYYFVIRNINEIILKLLNQVLTGDYNTATGSINVENETDSTPLKKMNKFLIDIIGIASGITTLWLYVGFKLSLFVLHTEDFRSLNSINYHIFGSPKKWYIIPPKYVARLEECFMRDLRKTFPNAPDCSLKHKQIYVTPELLDDWEVGYFEVYQTVGTIIVTSWNGYHFGYNTGENVAIAVNAVLLDWKMFHKEQINPCLCLGRTKDFGENLKKTLPDSGPPPSQISSNTKAVHKRKKTIRSTNSNKKQKDNSVTFGLEEEELVEPGNFSNKQLEFGHFCYTKGICPRWLQDDINIDFMMSIIKLLPPDLLLKLPKGFTGETLSALSFGVDTQPESSLPITPEIMPSSYTSPSHSYQEIKFDNTTTESEDYDETLPSNNNIELNPDLPSTSNTSFILSNQQQQPLTNPKVTVNINLGSNVPKEIVNMANQLPFTHPNHDVEINFNMPNSHEESRRIEENTRNENHELDESHWMVDRDSDARSSVSSALELLPSYQWPSNVFFKKPVKKQQLENHANLDIRPPTNHRFWKVEGKPPRYFCVCNNDYSRNDALVRHIDVMVSIESGLAKPFPCKIKNCFSAFDLRAKLTRHVRLTHNMNVDEYNEIVSAYPIDDRVNLDELN